MKKQITKLIQDLKSGKKLSALDEASVKQAVVLRLLSLLGWDIFDVEEVYPDYPLNNSVISYALRIDKDIQMLINVKSGQEKLDVYQKELKSSASEAGIDLSVLTNGSYWCFFLATGSSHQLHKRYCSFDIQKQKPENIADSLIDFMSRAKVAKGDALKTAKSTYRRQRQKIAAEALPEAWNQLLSPPNKILMEILSEITEKLCGFRADANLVEQFIKENLSLWQLNIPEGSRSIGLPEFEAMVSSDAPSKQKKEKELPVRLKSYASKSVKGYGFNGHSQNVKNWEELLLSLCEYFAASHSQDFEKVLWISDDQRIYFSTNSDELRIPEKIKKTDIYVETKLKPDDIVKIADDLLTEFGYDKNLLEIEVG